MTARFHPPRAVADYYASFPEERRLARGRGQLERLRTLELLERLLPRRRARIVDVGGAAGAYSFELAARGHEVHLVDASPRLVELARRRDARARRMLASLAVADARALPRPDRSADLVLVMGPLYHLPRRADRVAALREARRVVAPGGTVAAAAISRYASALDGLARHLSLDPRFVRIRDRDLRTGQHRNPERVLAWFTTAFFHRPDELVGELADAGLARAEVLGVEGPAWILPDFDARWSDARRREEILDVARALEREPSILGVSAHLLGIGRCARR